MDGNLVVELSALIIMLVVIVLIFLNRRQGSENGRSRGPDIRTLQHLALALVAPFVLILSLEKVIDPQATVAIYAVIVGYVFGSWGNKDSSGD